VTKLGLHNTNIVANRPTCDQKQYVAGCRRAEVIYGPIIINLIKCSFYSSLLNTSCTFSLAVLL